MPQSNPKPLGLKSPQLFTHGVFRFPGSFHPPLVHSIIEANKSAGLVGDPMVGSGTTAVYAVASGVDAFVADIDPLACLITRAKTTPVEPDVLRGLMQLIFDHAEPIGYRAAAGRTPDEAILEMKSDTPFRAPPNVYHWFHPTVARDLATLLTAAHSILRNRPKAERDAVLTVIASTIRRISRADPQPVSGLEVTAVRRQRLNDGLRFDLHAELFDRTETLAQGYTELLALPKLGRARVVRGDARKWSRICENQSNVPDVQIMSPPYLNAIEYWRRHRLEYFWLGLLGIEDYAPLSHRFFGAKVVRTSITSGMEDGMPASILDVASRLAADGFQHDSNITKQYFHDAFTWLNQVAAVAAAGQGDVFVIVGPSKRRGHDVDTPSLIVSLARKSGLRLVRRSSHKIVNQRMQFPLRNGGGIRTETVLHFGATDR